MLVRMSPEQIAENERLARQLVSRALQHDPQALEEALQMLGLEEYVSAKPVRKPVPEEDWVHGRRSTYTIQGCDCGPCTAANTAYFASRRAA